MSLRAIQGLYDLPVFLDRLHRFFRRQSIAHGIARDTHGQPHLSFVLGACHGFSLIGMREISIDFADKSTV